MAPNVTVSFWAADDINGTPLLTIDDEDEFFKGLKLQPDLYGVGGWELTLARNINFALFNSGAVQPEVFVRFLVHAYSDTDWFFGGQLNKRQQDVVQRDEAGAEEFVLGGPGPKQYMERYRLGTLQLSGGGSWLVDLSNGVWRFNESSTAGRVLNRLTSEDAAAANPACPDLTFTFDQTDDSDGNPWTDEIADADGNFELPIGNSLLQTIWDLEDLADLYTVIDLGTVASPKYELNAYQTYGEDVTGSSEGMGVCRLAEGINIANDSLVVTGVSLKKATHVIVEGKAGVWATTRKLSWSPGDYVKWAKIEYNRSSSEVILEKAGLRWLQRQDNGDQQFTIEIVPGTAEADGFYFPGAGEVLWLGNTITVDTTADGSTHSPLDYNNDPALVTGIDLELGPAGDDSTADKAAKSWDITVKLNYERGGNSGHPDQRSAATGGPGGRCCLPHPPYCEDPAPESETILLDTEAGDWGTLVTTGACWSGNDHVAIGASGAQSGLVSVSPGDIIRGVMNFREETGDDPWENNTNYDYHAVLRFEGPGMPFIDNLIVQQLYYQTGCINVTHSVTAEVPTGYNGVRIKIFSRLGGYRYNAYIAEVTAGSVPDNDPFCIDSDIPTDSPYTLPSDAIQYLIENHIYNIGQITRSMLNNSGDTLLEGDLVVPDLTHLNAVTTTSDPAQTASPVGIVTDGNEDGQDVVVGWFGVFSSVNIGGATATPGDYLFTSNADKEGDVNGTRSDGAVGQLAEDSGNVVLYLWGTPDSGAGGVTEHGDLTGLTDDDHPQYLRTTLGGRDAIEVHAAAGSTETLDLTNGNIHDVTLTANCTLTLSGATNGVGCTMNVLLRQGSGAPWTVTWPGSVAWVGGSAPTLETAVNAWNWVTLTTLDGGTVWFAEAVTASGGGGGAPTPADYRVGTAQGGLSAEIVVGTTPGGELGGTWASPTVDATHSGSAHHTESHQSRHNEGGADELKLDDAGIPDDNTDLNASTSAHGLLPKLDNNAAHYLDGQGGWTTPSGTGTTSPGPPDQIVLQSDCFNVGNNWGGDVVEQAGGTSAAVAQTGGEAGHPGVAGCGSGSTTTGRAFLQSPTNIILGNYRVRVGFLLNLPVLSDGTNTYKAGGGLGDGVSIDDIVDGVYFRYNSAVNSGKWQAVTVSNSVETGSATDTGVAADTNWHRFEIDVNAAGTSAVFKIDGSTVATNTTNIPTGVGRETSFKPGGIDKQAGGTSRSVRVDAFWLIIDK